MRSGLVFLSLAFLVVPNAVLAEAERPAKHEQRMAGLDPARSCLQSTLNPLEMLSAMVGEDFRVSISVTPARFDQDRARIVRAGDGNWWAIWDDDRMGNRKIFRQRYDQSGQPVSANEMIAGSNSGANYVDPRLAVDTLGRVYLSYRDQTNGMIYAARYEADGTVDWVPFLVNDTSLNSFAGPFDMTVFPDGQMVVVWEDYSSLGSAIRMRIYTASGASLPGPTVVNSDGGSANRWVPAVTHAPGSGFLVVWEDYRNGQADIYARQFTGAGTAVGSDFQVVPPPDNAAAQYSPTVTYSPFDRYVIGWVDLRSGQEIYLQRYDQTVGLVGGNEMISSGLGLVVNRDLDLSVSSAGQLHTIWSASGADNSIQLLTLDSGLAPTGLPEILNLSNLGQRWGPASRYDDSGNYGLVWTEAIDDNPDISLMLFDDLGSRLLVDEATANDDLQGAHSVSGRIIPTTDWWNLVTFADGRNDQGDIFVRAISSAGHFAGPEQRANQDAGSSLQSEPSLAASATRALLVWNDARTMGGFSGQRIFGRFTSPHGAFAEDEFLISGSGETAVKGSPRAVMRADGSGLVVWLDKRDGTSQVYGRWLATDGDLDGAEFLISQPGEDLNLTSLFLGLDGGDRISAIWFDAGSTTPTVRARVFDVDQTLIDSFSHSSMVSGVEIDEMAADVSADGTVAMFWTGADSGIRRAYCTRLSPDGTIVTPPFEITDSPNAQPSDPSVSVSDEDYVSMTWIDRRDGRRLAYYQILDASLTPHAVNLPVSAQTPEFMQSPMTDAYRGRAWFVWSDPRDDGLNVYAQPLIYLPTDVADDPPQLPTGYALSQNYPNPFNPSTEIEYSIPITTHVELTVINALGQTVTTLVDDLRSVGTHRLVWDGRDRNGDRVASGVYLYRLTTDDFTQTRKMLLLK